MSIVKDAPSRVRHISVCICTYKRPDLLRRALDRLDQQVTGNQFDYSVVVTDNDSQRSAEAVVTEFAARSRIEVRYSFESRQNIALARNKAIEHSCGDYIAFIDDDEFPEPDWLVKMLMTCEEYGAAGVLGPVRPHFDETPPSWIIRGGFCERPEHVTGRVMDWSESRTGNVLLQRGILHGVREPFKPQFGTGGEDKEFFMRMTSEGHVFRWCNEGVVYETVPPERWTRRYMLKRAMLRGRNILKLPVGRAGLIARSVVALPVYSVMLPFTLLLGQHVFMKYCIKFCDHGGRLLTMLGINPVHER